MAVRNEEVLVLDPGSGEIDLTVAPFELEAFTPGVAKRRPNWVTGPDVDGAVLDEEPRYENAESTLRIRVWQDDPTAMDAALAAVGQLLDKLQQAPLRDGGLPVLWTPAQSSESYTMYVLLAELDGIPVTATGDDAGWLQARPVLPITLTRRPFLYGAPVGWTNLIKNPSGEVNATDGGWSGVNCVVTTVAGSSAPSGASTFMLTASLATSSMSMRNDGDRFDVTPGEPYSAAAEFRPWSGLARDTLVAIDFYDATGTRIVVTAGDVVTEVSGSYVRAVVENAIAPLGAVNAQLIVEVDNPSNSEQHRVDEIIAVHGPKVPAYFDGDQPDAAWTGTAHDSTSIGGNVVSGSAPLLVLEVPDVGGDVAAEGRLVVVDNAGVARRHVEWGLEQRGYTPDAPAPLILDSDSLVTSGFSGLQATRSNAYDPNASGNNTIQGNLSTVPIAVCGTGAQKHVGTFRVKARVIATSQDVRVRLTWHVGTGPPRSNPSVVAPVADDFAEIDLGLVTIPPAGMGVQQWTGQVDAWALSMDDPDSPVDDSGSPKIWVDVLELIPAGDGYGRARAAWVYKPGALVAHDEFAGMADNAALSGRVSPAGGSWSTSGAATDFAKLPDNDYVSRATTGEASARLAVLGSTSYAAVEVSAAVYNTIWQRQSGLRAGVIARYVDASNHVRAFIASSPWGNNVFRVEKIVGGTVTALAYVGGSVNNQLDLSAGWYTVRLIVFTSGSYIAQVVNWRTQKVIATLTGNDSALATGGTLASGKPGLIDQNATATAAARSYDDFNVATPPSEPVVLQASRILEIRHDSCIRQSSDGTYWGPVPAYRGGRFFVPPAGGQARTSRIAVKARRNDIETASDVGLADSLTVQAVYVPRYLAPRT